MLYDFPPLVFALRFLLTLPRKSYLEQPPSYTRLAADFIVYYVVTFVFAICYKVVAVLMRSKVSLRACVMMALFATVYWAPVNLLDYITFSDLQVRKMLTIGFSTSPPAHHGLIFRRFLVDNYLYCPWSRH
jgi:hypothetical protein